MTANQSSPHRFQALVALRGLTALTALWVLAVLIGVAASGVYLIRTANITSVWTEIPVGTIAAELGSAYRAGLGRSDLSSHEKPSSARVLEDGRFLGPANSQQADVRVEGRGRYSFQYDYVLFSASDNSDPRRNGRRYTVSYPPVGASLARALYVAASLLLLAAIVASTAALRDQRAAVEEAIYTGARAFGAIVVSASPRTGSRLRPGPPSFAWWRPAAGVLFAASCVSVATVLFVDREVHLARTGQSTRYWEYAPLQRLTPDIGSAYVAHTGRRELSSHLEPSIARVLENGRPLPIANSQHVGIREQGAGRFSFWHDYVIFSSSDNTDPRTNGRAYAIAYPLVDASEVRLLFALTLVLIVVAALAAVLVLRTRAFGDWPAHALRTAWARRTWVLVVSSAAAIVVTTLARVERFSDGSMWVAWGATAALLLVTTHSVRHTYGAVIPRRILAVLLLAMATGHGILTTSAPHRWQGCHTTEPLTAWEAFCVSGDSASYYLGYGPGASRNPLYPWFIAAVTAGTDFQPAAYVQRVKPGGVVRSESDPLFRVVKAQIVLLLAASVLLAAAAMVMLKSLVPAAAIMAMYDAGFFTAYELNIVLTEPLVQTVVFLLIATFLAFLHRARPVWLIAAALFCGLAYLTRQAAAYSALFLMVMIGRALLQDWRRWWKPSAVAVALLAMLVAIPEVYTFARIGSVTLTQESIQYQYRTAHAMQYVTAADVDLMPNPGTKAWLLSVVRLRDIEHRAVDAKYKTEYDRMTYYINQNLYAVAMPYLDPDWASKLPMAEGRYTRVSEFFMAVATPILARHWTEYLQFSFRFWQLGLSYVPVSRIHLGPLGAWMLYAILWLLILVLHDRHALASATLILAHWGHVAIASMFAVPIARMVWASEFMVILAAVILVLRVGAALVTPRPPHASFSASAQFVQVGSERRQNA